MKNIFLSFLVLATIVLAAGIWSLSTGSGCSSGEYYSGFTHKCEEALLQVGKGDLIESLTIEDLKSRFKLTELEVAENPAYKGNSTDKKERVYKGFSLKELITSYIGAEANLDDYVVAITCLDGYDPLLDGEVLNKLNELNAVIAIEQVTINSQESELTKDGLWDMVPAAWGRLNPGPFYLVWESTEGTYPKGWPFQINSLQIMPKDEFENLYAQTKPPAEHLGKKPISEVESGFNQFKGKCLTCHNVNGVGGSKAKVNLVERVSALAEDQSYAYIKAMVDNPPAGMADVRAMKMSDENIKHINLYLRSMEQ